MIFKDNEHQTFYEEYVRKTHSESDPYRQSLFYTLGLTNETRKNIESLYDFEECGIHFDGLFSGWQTGTSIRVTRLAFNLYNGFTGDTLGEKVDSPKNYTPYNLFDTDLMPYFFEAVKLRYPEYYRTITANKNLCR